MPALVTPMLAPAPAPIIDPALAPWRDAARIRPLLPGLAAHSIHAYFNTCPESPDGRHVLIYVSTADDGGHGELRAVRRADGAVRTLAAVHEVEDAHRAACQQWCDGGRTVAFHDRRAGRWQVLAVDLDGGNERVLAVDRQLGFGTPATHEVPLYGCHWRQPAECRDLELADVRSGRVRTALTMDAVLAAHGEWIRQEFGADAAGRTGVFFPVLSPDGQRVFFKLARGRGDDDHRGMDASHRAGKLVWDLAAGRPLARFAEWGHPSWTPDSTAILEKGQVVTKMDGTERQLAPGSHSDHPSMSPDGRLFVTDGNHAYSPGGRAGERCIVVGSATSGEHLLLHHAPDGGGARSWRRPHPHPVFSADNRRIYFNLNDSPWTTLHVAEIAP